MAGFFLNGNHFGADIIQELLGKSNSPLICNIMFAVSKVGNHLIDAINTNGREVITQSSKITFGEREQSLIN